MVRINGNDADGAAGMSVAAYLKQNGYRPAQIAVELNEEILPKDLYAETVLKDGDVMEIVMFMGGGR